MNLTETLVPVTGVVTGTDRKPTEEFGKATLLYLAQTKKWWNYESLYNESGTIRFIKLAVIFWEIIREFVIWRVIGYIDVKANKTKDS